MPSRMEIEAEIGRRLARRRMTVAVAESCTGGLIGYRLTSVPGSSKWFQGGVIAYSNEVKARDLGVDRKVLKKEGAVSDPVARRMAEGVRTRFGVDMGVAVTGIAGPGGGTPSKPVGLVFVSVSWDGGCEVRRCKFAGDRTAVRLASSTAALEVLRECLEKRRQGS